MFSAQGISLFLFATGRIQKETKDSDQSERLHSESMEAIRESCATGSSRRGVLACLCGLGRCRRYPRKWMLFQEAVYDGDDGGQH